MSRTMIRIDKLRKEFYDVVAVRDICLEVGEGEIFGLIGPNGAGKTTTIRMLATSLKPTSGTAYIEDLNILKDEVKIRNIIGFMPDFFSLYNDLKVWELLDYFACAHGIGTIERRNRINEAIQVADLENKRNSLVEGLSRGMMQRLCLARALIHRPKVLFLDEPASGLDPKARFALRDHLKKLNRDGVTILISSHILTELSDLCTSIGIMEKGVILNYGPISEISQKISLPRRLLLEVISDVDTVVNILKSDDKVSDMEVNGMLLSFEYKGGKEDIATLNKRLIDKNVRIVSTREVSRTLEDIFLNISKGETA